MTILMLLDHSFPPDIRVEHEVSSLLNAGHEVHIACFTFTDEPIEDYWKEAIIHRKKISSLMHKTSVGCLKFPFYFNFWRTFVGSICKDHSFDAIHIHDLPLAQIGLEMKEKAGLRFILDLHENWPGLLNISTHVQGPLGRLLSSDQQWRNYERSMVDKADEVIVVVEESKERIQSFTDHPSKIHVVSNTPVIEELELLQTKKAQPSSKMSLFYGGGVTQHRGLQYIINALKTIQNDQLELWIAGDGSYLETLKELTKDLELENQVKFFGWVELNEMTRIMQKADVLLIPHKKTEHSDSTIPHKLFQYMLTGKPILASNCNPIERIILETESGYIYTYDDIDNFIEKLNKIYIKWKKGEELKMKGAGAVLETYNWARDEKILVNIYNK